MQTLDVQCQKCRCQNAETSVQIQDIETNQLNQDVLTFICPECGSLQKSLRLAGRPT
jgi:Zn finger protein HypA/HybF involved in hydrogenase expression